MTAGGPHHLQQEHHLPPGDALCKDEAGRVLSKVTLGGLEVFLDKGTLFLLAIILAKNFKTLYK